MSRADTISQFNDRYMLIVGRGHIFIYLCSQTLKLTSIKTMNAEHKHMNMCPLPTS